MQSKKSLKQFENQTQKEKKYEKMNYLIKTICESQLSLMFALLFVQEKQKITFNYLLNCLLIFVPLCK